MSFPLWFGRSLRSPLPLLDEPLLIRDVAVLDPQSGSLRPHHDLLVARGRIAAVAPTGQVSEDDKLVIHAAGLFALPGLIDCHAHVCGAYLTGPPTLADLRWIPRQILKNLRAFLQSGVTTVRDMAGPLNVSRWLRYLAREGRIASPRLLISGPILTARNGYPSYVPPLPPVVRSVLGRLRVDVDTSVEAQAWVDRLARRGVDVVKVAYTSLEYDDAQTAIPLLDPAVLRTITERAHDRGLPVAVHHIFARDLPTLLEVDFDTLEHLSIEATIRRADVERIRERELPVTTTLMTYGIIDYLAELEVLLAQDEGERFEPRPVELVAAFVGEIQRGTFQVPFIGRRVIETGMRHMLQNLRLLREAGVLVGAGTDSGGAITPCGKLIWELRAMQRAGCSALEALRAATSDAARVIGQPDLGVLAPGRTADVVLCRGNPADDLSALERIELVVRDGRLFDPSSSLSSQPRMERT